MYPMGCCLCFRWNNDILSSIETMLNDVLDRHIPLKSKRVKRPNQPGTKQILHSMKTCEGQTTNLLRKAKRSFFRKEIDENKGNPKGFWKALKSWSWTSKPRVPINEITTENGVVSDEAVFANELNEYFVNILEQIGNNNDAGVDFENTKLKNFVHSRLKVDTVYNIPLLTIKQTFAIIYKISANKASGYDGLSVRVLKKIAPVFANLLCKLLNLSISTNSFPCHCTKVEHEMISTVFAPSRFYLCFRKFSKSMWPALHLFSYVIIESFRFYDEYDNEYKVFSILRSARAWTSVILARKKC